MTDRKDAPTDPPAEELAALLEACLNDEIDEAGTARLEELVVSDPVARRKAVEYLCVSHDLRAWAEGGDTATEADDSAHTTEAPHWLARTAEAIHWQKSPTYGSWRCPSPCSPHSGCWQRSSSGRACRAGSRTTPNERQFRTPRSSPACGKRSIASGRRSPTSRRRRSAFICGKTARWSYTQGSRGDRV
jgi:hypothetical protein